jgi:hypothetical protein
MSPAANPIRIIIERVGAEHPAPAIFFGYETDEWPTGAMEVLAEKRFIIESGRATSAVCTGCGIQCHKDVVVRRLPAGGAGRAFIVCDEQPDHGRIPLRLEHLRRFQASFATVARLAADCLDLSDADLVSRPDHVQFGTVRGRNGLREVSLVLRQHRIALLVGQQEKNLTDLLTWKENGLRFDKSQLKRMADRKVRLSKGLVAGQLATPVREKIIAERDREIVKHGRRLKPHRKSWTVVSEEIARMPFISSPKEDLRPIKAPTVRRIIAKLMHR